MFPFPHMMNFFADKFARLRGWRFAFPGVLLSTFDGLFFRHSSLLCQFLSLEFRHNV